MTHRQTSNGRDMRILFVHPHFPGHFATLAYMLTQQHQWDCCYLTSVKSDGYKVPFRVASYKLRGQPPTESHAYQHPAGFADHVAHAEAAYAAARSLRDRYDFQPDLIVGHACAGSYAYLKQVWNVPILGYFDFLPQFPWQQPDVTLQGKAIDEAARLPLLTDRAMTLLQLNVADAIYTPTEFQHSTLPPEYQNRAQVIFDTAQMELAPPHRGLPIATGKRPARQRDAIPASNSNWTRPAKFRGHAIGPETKVVTYVSRGLEAARGFDVFMKLVGRLCQQFEDLAVFIAGEPRSFYGNESPAPGMSFRDWVLSQDQFDLSRIHFLGRIPGEELPALFNISDLHIYLTVPMVLSWSCLHAMAAGCTILGSRTPPVMEVITDGVHGLLADFADVDDLTACATKVLSQPLKYRYLGANARYRVLQKYSPEQTLPAFVKLAEKTARAK